MTAGPALRREPANGGHSAALAAIATGALLLLWPAFVNGYPLLFSDTGAFLAQTLVPLMIWDKPWVYGPMLHALHWRTSLWLPLVAQAFLVSHLLWLLLRTLRGSGDPGWHLVTCAGAALLTTAPFTVALLMPDVFAPVVLLCLALLGFGCDGATRGHLSRSEAVWLGIVATLGIATHLSHLPLALALVTMGALLAWRWRPVARMAAPLLGAVVLLLATNYVGHGRLSLSPHGATFLLARLQDDGPATRTLQAECPARGWYLCAFTDTLPMDSDRFLWDPDSPVNRDAAGASRFLGGALLSAEAGEIVAETLRREPWAVLGVMARNATRQMFMTRIGDTLVADHLEGAVGSRLRAAFPPAEALLFSRSLQLEGALQPIVAPLVPLHAAVLVAGLVLAGLGLWQLRREPLARALLVLVLVGVAANALATGGLSKPHHRYEARILWLLPVVAALTLAARRRP